MVMPQLCMAVTAGYSHVHVAVVEFVSMAGEAANAWLGGVSSLVIGLIFVKNLAELNERRVGEVVDVNKRWFSAELGVEKCATNPPRQLCMVVGQATITEREQPAQERTVRTGLALWHCNNSRSVARWLVADIRSKEQVNAPMLAHLVIARLEVSSHMPDWNLQLPAVLVAVNMVNVADNAVGGRIVEEQHILAVKDVELLMHANAANDPI